MKEKMKDMIRSLASQQIIDGAVAVTENMEDARFSKFEGIQWRRSEPNYDNRWKIRRKQSNVPKIKMGPDSLFPLSLVQTSQKSCDIARQRLKKGLNGSTKQDFDGGVMSTQPWKEIPPEDIPRVALSVLNYFRSVDEKKLFETPVLESLPEIAEMYLKAVTQPMDFKTIEERIPSYTSITNLRDDLIQTFQNCISFNGPESKFGQIAQQMLDDLDDAIEATDLKRVTSKVLNIFREIDARELFAIPVLEQLPALRDSYLEVVKTPMDFQTIEEERVNSYCSISDLENDLYLIFDNCINFNQPTSVYGQIAQQMKDMVNGVVHDVFAGKRAKKRKVCYDAIVDPADESGGGKEKTTSHTKKKMTYNALQKELRNTQKELKAERAKNQELKRRIRALEGGRQQKTVGLKRRIRALEGGRQKKTVGSPKGPSMGGCRECKEDNDWHNVLLCDGCEAEYHFYCAGFDSTPRGAFYCGKLYVRCEHYALIQLFVL